MCCVYGAEERKVMPFHKVQEWIDKYQEVDEESVGVQYLACEKQECGKVWDVKEVKTARSHSRKAKHPVALRIIATITMFEGKEDVTN